MKPMQKSSMLKWFHETLNTLSLATYHPLGWGFERFQTRFIKARSGSPQLLRHTPIVFVHGIFHNQTAFFRFQRELRKHGYFNTKVMELWTSFFSLEEMAERLKTSVRTLLEKSGQAKATLIAHSLGGMVTRTALLDEQFAQKVDQVIFLGTPHQGTQVYGSPFPICLRSLKANATIMKRLKSEPLPTDIRIWNLRGELDFVTPARSTYLPHVPNLDFESVGHAGLLVDPKVIEAVVTILSENNL